MKRLTAILLLFGAVFLSAAAPEATMILLNDREAVTVEPDGTNSTVDECVYQVLNHRGLRQLQKMSFHFNADYGTISVTHLAIVKPDGKRITVDPAKNSAVSTESSQMDSAIYDPANKVLHVTVPGLEIGDTLEVTTLEKQTKARLPGEFSDIAVLQADFPIKNYEYSISMPAGKPLNFCVKDEVPGTLTFAEKRQDSRIIYSWTAKNVPQAIPETAMPPMYTCTQRVLVSTVKSWEDISRWYDKLCEPHLAKVNEAMKQKTAVLTAGNKTDMEKITALFQFVSQQIRYTGVTDEESAPGYEPHDVDRTFDQKHGVCRDKAALLVAMLKLAGFKAYPTLFMSGTPKDPEIANIYFNHAIVAVETAPGRYILMDPTFETTTELFPGYLAGDSYLVAKPQGDTLRTVPPVKAESNLLEINTNVKNAAARMEIKFSGIYDTMFRSAFSEWHPDDIRNFFASLVREIMPGAEFTKVNIRPENVRDMSCPLAVTVDFKIPDSGRSDRDLQALTLPRAGIILGNMRTLFTCTALKKRRFPLRVMPRAVREKIVMQLAPGFKYELPPDIDLQEKGLLRLQSKSSIKNHELTEEFFMALDSMRVSPQDYPKFRSAAAAARNNRLSMPIAEKNTGYSTDGEKAEVIKVVRHYDIIDPHSWKYTVTSHFRVLNYAGMKYYANIPLEYVESCGKPEISAIVTDSKGQKHTLSTKDIQYMDDEEISAVPRYAKRKLAVITLPGMDVGSTVELTVSTLRKNMPGFSTGLLTRSDTPALASELIIEHPAKMKLKISDIPPEIRDSITFGGKRIIRRYTVGKSPRLSDEPDQPDPSVFVPGVKITSLDFAELANYYTSAAQKQVDAASPEIAGLARKIAAGKKSPAEIADAVEKYVYRHIRKVNLPLNDMLPSDFSAPQTTLRDGCGNSADRAILMAAMLKSLGIGYRFIPVTCEPFSSRRADQLREFPENICSDLLLKVDTGKGSTVCLNDSGLHAPAGTLHHQEYMCLDNGKLDVLVSGDKNGKHLNISVTLKKDLSAEVTLKYAPHGTHLEKLREQFAGFTPATERQFFEKYASGIAPQAEILESGFASDTMMLKLHIPDFARRSGKFVYLPLPAFQLLNAELSIPAKKRETPYFHRSQLNMNMDYEISVPENFRIVRPEPLNISAGTIFFDHDYLYLAYNRKHLISFMLTKQSGIASPEIFEYLRQLKNKLNDFSTEHIFFITE